MSNGVSSRASTEHATTQASHAHDSIPVATNIQVASTEREHVDGPFDDPIASHHFATGADDGNAAQAAAAVYVFA